MIEPRLRFKADDGSDFPDWEEKILGELGTFTKGAALSKADISDEGNPLILYGELYTTYKEVAYEVKRKTQAIVDKIYYSNVGDVLIPTSGESAEEISTATCVMVPNVILAGDLNIFRSTVIDGRIMSYILNYQAKWKIATIAQGKSIVHIQAKQLGKIFVEYPVDKDEQQKIADFLSTIDTIIEKQWVTVSAWEERKKGVMQKLFSQEVRFKADDGSDFPDWEEKRLGDVFEERTERSVGGEELLSVTISQGVIRQSDSDKRNNSSENKSNYKVVKKNDLAYNTMRMWQGAEGVSDFDGIVSPAYTVVTPLDGNNGKYFEIFFKQISMLHLFQRYSQGLTSDTWNLKFPSFAKIKCCVPCEKEQNKIVNCIVLLDTVIQKQKETLEKWQELKKGLLQQMFV